MEGRKTIPRFNQDLEFPLVVYVIRKNLVWIIAVLVLLLAASFLYLRYTIPHYQSITIIQLTEENAQHLDFLEDKKMMNLNQTMAGDIELMRSQVFIQRIVDSLNVEVTYFKDGRILDYDNYNQAPYKVLFIENTPEVFGIPIFVKFNSIDNFNIKYKIGEQKFDYTYNTNTIQKTPHFKFLISVVDSSAVLKPVNADYFILNSKSTLLSRFSSQLQVIVLNESARTIKISVTDVNPQRANDIANMIAKEFTNFNLEKKKQGVNNIISYIDNTLELVKLNLNEADSSLQKFMSDHNIVERTNDENPIEQKNMKMLEMLENQKFDYEIQLLVLNDVIKNVNKQDIDIYEVLTQISQLKADAYITNLAGNINILISKRDRLLQGKTNSHPDVIEVNREIDVQRNLLIKSLEAIKLSTNSKINELQSAISQIEGSFYSSGGNLPNQVEYMHRKRYYEVNETYYQMLIQKRVEYELLSEGYTSSYRVLQRSAVAKTPIYPRKFFVLAVVLVVWVVIAIAGLTINYILYDRILAFEHITSYCNVSILGFVTKYKSTIPVSQLVVDKKPKSLIAESFRNIRTNLDFISNKPGSKLIAVTSTISGEGKTFVSINLAGILAFTGKKVIIIDADMRKPKIHVGFNVSNDKGLSNLLIGKNSIQECVFHSELENLHFITAGPIPPNPSELILSDNMTQLIDTLKKDYDYVLIDNPPIGIVTDSMTLLKRADYPIYVFRAGVSRKFFINNLQKLVVDNKMTNMSIILNGLEQKKSNQYGYGNYGYTTNNYGYGYGYYDEDHKKKRSKFSTRRKK